MIMHARFLGKLQFLQSTLMSTASQRTALSSRNTSTLQPDQLQKKLTWTQRFGRPLSSFMLFSSIAFIALENLRLQFEHHAMETDDANSLDILRAEQQSLRSQLDKLTQ
ncbi:hypothetical protein MT418_005743 [Batrachochytrium dendrobatidis]